MSFRPILSLDFDGVLHSYTTPWKNARTIPDEPVPGALEFLVAAQDAFQVAIHSSRSHQWLGRAAMKRWLRGHLVAAAGTSYDDCATFLRDHIAESMFADPWADEAAATVRRIVGKISFPLFKPPATVTLDDRALQFTGDWPDLKVLQRFRPWNKVRRAVGEAV